MNKKVYIIAEAGVNHNGDIKLAKKMIEEAARAGVNAIKFQSFKAEDLVTKSAEKANYQKIGTGTSGKTQYQMLKKLELDRNAHHILFEHCKKYNIDFLSSPFELNSLDLLISLELSIFKIPSGEINNVPLLRKIARLNKKVILSTGMSTLTEIEFALNLLVSNGTKKDNITVLHCNTEYPTLFGDVNLNAMLTIHKTFQIEVGYSDHTLGIAIPIAAVAMGAKVIEKHFTLDKTMDGPDHKASIDSVELKEMVLAIRNVELALGSGIKEPSQSELKNIKVVRKSIVAACEIKKGEKFTDINLTIKRPGTGLSPSLWDEIVGKFANMNYSKDEMISID
jgi:N,N'-diacetyllegionaminate synthase